MTVDQQGALRAIRTRRVVRHFTSDPITTQEMRKILVAARWAPTEGNRRVHRYVAILDPETIRLVVP